MYTINFNLRQTLKVCNVRVHTNAQFLVYRNSIYGPVEFLEVGCLVFDPKTYLLTYNIRHAIFRIAFLPPDKRWVVMYRPSYSIGYHKVGSTGYQKAIKQNILVTRSSEKIKYTC